jgi:tetratricopeptide (TPR) repeat protein
MVDFHIATFLVDIGDQLNEAKYVHKGIQLIRTIKAETLPPQVQGAWRYNLGNGHSTLFRLKRIAPGLRRAQDEDFRHAKEYYREAMDCTGLAGETKARILTNDGNLHGKVGRHLEAIERCDLALKEVPEYPMALMNKALALGRYVRLADRARKRIDYLEARRLLAKSVAAGLEVPARKMAEEELLKLEKILPPSHSRIDTPTKHVASSALERDYIAFCLKNRLYLHPCPHESHQAYLDPLSADFQRVKDGAHRARLAAMVSSLKGEYVAARFLLFSPSLRRPDLRFVDRGTFPPLGALGAGQGVYSQFVKLSFRSAYGIFDKIAYFLNGYCNIGLPAKEIYFRPRLFACGKSIRDWVTHFDGLPLAALYDLSLDFEEAPLRDLREVRHKLEHTCVIVTQPGVPEKGDVQQPLSPSCDEDSCVLGEDVLREGALHLLRCARAAIFYLLEFVRATEKLPTL